MSPLQVKGRITVWLLSKGCANQPDRQNTPELSNVTRKLESRRLKGILLVNSALQALLFLFCVALGVSSIKLKRRDEQCAKVVLFLSLYCTASDSKQTLPDVVSHFGRSHALGLKTQAQ